MPTYLIVGLHSWSRRIYKEIRNESPVGDIWIFCNDPNKLEETILKYCPKKIFFVHWSYKVPKYYTDHYECICFHPTELPYGRGGTPVQNLIELGYASTVLTAFRMTDEIDAGPIYLRSTRISLEGKAQDIYNRIANYTIQLIRRIVRENPEPFESELTPYYFKRRIPKESCLDEGKTKQELYDFIRMLDAEDYPHAFVNVHGYHLEFTDAKFEGNELTAKVRIKYVGER